MFGLVPYGAGVGECEYCDGRGAGDRESQDEQDADNDEPHGFTVPCPCDVAGSNPFGLTRAGLHRLPRQTCEGGWNGRARLRKLGVQLISVTESLEESASGKLVEGILASIAEFYSANLSQEIRKGTLQKVKEGGWPRPAPVGYRNVRIPRGGRRGEAIIVPDEKQAPFVRQAFELYATGEWPLTRLHEEMTERGLRCRAGTILARSQLAKLLHNRVYLGKVVWRGVEHEGTHEPLVSRELFDRVQRSSDYTIGLASASAATTTTCAERSSAAPADRDCPRRSPRAASPTSTAWAVTACVPHRLPRALPAGGGRGARGREPLRRRTREAPAPC